MSRFVSLILNCGEMKWKQQLSRWEMYVKLGRHIHCVIFVVSSIKPGKTQSYHDSSGVGSKLMTWVKTAKMKWLWQNSVLMSKLAADAKTSASLSAQEETPSSSAAITGRDVTVWPTLWSPLVSTLQKAAGQEDIRLCVSEVQPNPFKM